MDAESSAKTEKYGIIAAIVSVVFLLCIGTVAFHLLEGWSYVDAFYFTGITITTVGYGDIFPTHAISKIMAVFFALLGVSVVLFSLGIIARHYFIQQQNDIAQISQRVRSNAAFIYKPIHKGISHIRKNGLKPKE